MQQSIISKFLNLKKISILIETFETFRLMNINNLKNLYQKIKNTPTIWKVSKSPLDKLRVILESINSLGQVLTVFRSPLEKLVAHTRFRTISKFLRWLPNHPVYVSAFVITSAALKILEIYQRNKSDEKNSNDSNDENV